MHRRLATFFFTLAGATALHAQVPVPEPAPPVDPADLEASLERGVTFLLQDQNRDGSWGTPHQTKGLNIYAPVPGAHHAFRAATTALCVTALHDVCGENCPDEVLQARRRGENWLLENLPTLRRATADAIYNVWGHIYSIQALVAMRRVEDDLQRKQAIEIQIDQQVDLLERYESVDGGWGYYDFRVGTKQPSASSISFVSAAALVAFHDLKETGLPAPERLAQRAYDSIQRQRKSDNTYAYGEYLKMSPMRGINRPGGSLGRSQACNIALRYWGDETVTDQVLENWLNRLFARNGWLDIGRKRPIPHEAWFQVAGYFYYFGHYYGGRCIQALPAKEAEPFKDLMAATLMPLQEKDGSWWDYPLYNYHQQYGTAFALMTLAHCR